MRQITLRDLWKYGVAPTFSASPAGDETQEGRVHKFRIPVGGLIYEKKEQPQLMLAALSNTLDRMFEAMGLSVIDELQREGHDLPPGVVVRYEYFGPSTIYLDPVERASSPSFPFSYDLVSNVRIVIDAAEGAAQ